MRIGIDLGGTKIEGLVLDAGGVERERLRIATPDAPYEASIEAIATLVATLEARVGQRCRVGIAHPGAISPATGLIKNANSTRLNDRPLKADLERRLDREIRMANDANCFALSEAVDGAGAGSAVVFGAVLGTGVGGGIVVYGRCLGGAHGVAGEWGHTPLPWRSGADGPELVCACGKLGCIETVLSGGGLVNAYNNLSGLIRKSEEIAKLAVQGEREAESALELYFRALAKALAGVVNFLDPDVIVLGGGLSDLPGILDKVSSFWKGLALVAEPRTRLLRARHGADSGVRGAAWLARQGETETAAQRVGGGSD